MASIGLKVNNSSTGVDLASQLAKALMGDPNLELEMAKAGIWADTQRAQQGQIRSATEYNSALTAASSAKTAREEEDRRLQREAVPGYTQVVVDSMGQPAEVPAPETQAPPVVVADPTEAAIAAPPTRGGLTIGPLPVDVPVQEDRATRVPFLPSMSQVSAPIEGVGPIAGRPGGPQLPMPPAPPPRSMSTFPARPGGPMPSPPMLDNRPVPPRSWLQQLLSGMTPFEDMERIGPVSTFPARPEPYATRAEDPVPLELPPAPPSPELTSSIGALDPRAMPETPVSLEDIIPRDLAPKGAAPPNVVPMGQQGQQQPNTNAPLVAPPLPPTLAAAANAPPEEKPAAAAAAGQEAAAAATGANGGADDTPEAVTTKQGAQLPRAVIEAMVRDIMIGDESPEVKMQTIQRLMGTLGLTYNPAFGKDPTETVKVATLAAGGTAPGKDSAAVALTAAPETLGAYEGTGIDAQDHNTITGVMAEDAPSPEQARAYALAFGRQYGKTTYHREEDAKGNIVEVKDPPYIPPGVPTPEEVYARAGIAAPKATSAETSVGTPDAAVAAQAEPATSTGGTMTGTGTGGRLIKKKTVDQTKEMGDNTAYYAAAKVGNADLDHLNEKDMPNTLEYGATDPNVGGANNRVGAIIDSLVSGTAYTINPGLRRYWGAAQAFGSPILRKESGAATRPEDMKSIVTRYIPMKDEPADVRATKKLRRELAVEGLRLGMFKEIDETQRMAEVDAYVDQKIAEMDQVTKNRPADDTGTSASTPVPANAAEAGITQAEWDAMPREEQTVWR